MTLAVVGLFAFDGIALVAARFTAADQAQTAAVAAADSWAQTKDVQKAYNAAVTATASSGDLIETKSFTVATDGTVSLTLHREATTLLLHHVSALRHWADATQTAKGRPGT